MKMAMREQVMNKMQEMKNFKASLTPYELELYKIAGRQGIEEYRNPKLAREREAEREEKRMIAREEREQKVYGEGLRITGNESDEELMRKITARANKDDEEYREEKEKENKMREESKAKRMKVNWKVSMTVKEMTALLRENGKSGYSGKRKAELIEMIEKFKLKD